MGGGRMRLGMGGEGNEVGNGRGGMRLGMGGGGE